MNNAILIRRNIVISGEIIKKNHSMLLLSAWHLLFLIFPVFIIFHLHVKHL